MGDGLCSLIPQKPAAQGERGDLAWGAFMLGEEAMLSHKVIIQGLVFPSWEETSPHPGLTCTRERNLGLAGDHQLFSQGCVIETECESHEIVNVIVT